MTALLKTQCVRMCEASNHCTHLHATLGAINLRNIFQCIIRKIIYIFCTMVKHAYHKICHFNQFLVLSSMALISHNQVQCQRYKKTPKNQEKGKRGEDKTRKGISIFRTSSVQIGQSIKKEPELRCIFK